MKCKICGKEDPEVNENNQECDECWYGMRIDPENWIKDLKKQGIEVERDIGCIICDDGIVCGNPYKRKQQRNEDRGRKEEDGQTTVNGR